MRMGDMEPILRSYIIRAIRQAFVRSKTYEAVKRAARVERSTFKLDGTKSKRKSVSYKCSGCGKEFKANDINIDHRNPVTEVLSATVQMTVEQYIRRVFCSAENLQVLCSNGKDSCHAKKTISENQSRVKRDRIGNLLKPKKKSKKVNKLKI